MTYKKEVEKAVKAYLLPLGFKYRPKTYNFFRQYSDEITQDIGFAYETHGRSHYYFMRTFIGVNSMSLNKILFEVTDGIVDYRNLNVGPVYHSRLKFNTERYSDYEYIHCEFIGDRPMEENIADLDRMFKTDAQFLFDMYNTQKAIYTCSAHEEVLPFNPVNTPGVFFYGPLGFFFDGQFDKAFEYIERWIQIAKDNINTYGVCDEFLESKSAYEAMRKNLKKWIAERRQFKVDDEYLPSYDNYKPDSFREGLQKVQSLVSKILKPKIKGTGLK